MPELVSLECDLHDTGLAGRFASPVGVTGRPGLLVIGGSEGGSRYATLLSHAVAEQGIPTLGIAYHRLPGLPSALRLVPLEYFDRALRWLAERDEVDPGRLVVWGSSRGSEAALLTALHFADHVAGIVALVPGNVVLCSWPPGDPAWTLGGQPLAYTSRFGPECEHPAAYIPVELIAVPMFLLSAGRDDVWPSSEMARAIAERRSSAGRGGGDRVIDLPHSDHSGGSFDAVACGRGTDEERQAWDEIIHFVATIPARGWPPRQLA